MIVLTFDTDWTPDFMLEGVVETLSRHGLGGTMFCTGPLGFEVPGCVECGLHPNLMADSTQGDGERDILDTLCGHFPDAVGVRTHRLFWHGGLYPLLVERGLRYDSSQLLPFQPGLEPVWHGGLVRFSVWWTDNVHMQRRLPWDGRKLVEDGHPGLKVMNFHPVYIALNDTDGSGYRRLLAECGGEVSRATPQMVRRLRQSSAPGAQDLFEKVCALLVEQGTPAMRLQDVLETKPVLGAVPGE